MEEELRSEEDARTETDFQADEETAGEELNQADDIVSTSAEKTHKRPIIPISIAVGAAVGVVVKRKSGK